MIPSLIVPCRASPMVAPIAVMAALLLSACSANMAPQDDSNVPRSGPAKKYDPRYDESVFGKGGVSLSNLHSGATGGILGGPPQGSDTMPVNKYLWRAALDTLSFLPLASTDPFTGVIATDWGTTPEAPDERFKVTVYITSPVLSAASLKVAVFREKRDEQGLWVPAPVSAETVTKLEDAILARAREIRIAAKKGSRTG